jgi:hypothetical protein
MTGQADDDGSPPDRHTPSKDPHPRGTTVHLVRAGHLIISVEHLVSVEDATREPEPQTLPAGILRMTLAWGRVMDVGGATAAMLRTYFDGISILAGTSPTRAPVVGTDPFPENPDEPGLGPTGPEPEPGSDLGNEPNGWQAPS